MSCNEKEVDVKISPDVFHNVVDKVIDIMVDDIFSPPVASRIFAYSNFGLATKKRQLVKKFKQLYFDYTFLN